MRLWLRYVGGGLGLVLGGVAATWIFLAPDQRLGVAVGGMIAYLVQVVAFGLLLRYRDRLNAFLAVWVGGTLVRMGVVLGVGLMLITRGGLDPASLLLALASFFFGLLLLESVFFRPGSLGTN